MALKTNNYDPAQKYGAEYKDPKFDVNSYLDNTAALAAGLEVNDVYKTPTGELRIVV